MTDLAPLLSSRRADWCTPLDVLSLVRRVAPGGRVALDPCGNRFSLVGARIAIAPPGDGLAADWRALASDWLDDAPEGLVYVNPPYGRGIGRWVRKCAREGLAGASVIALLPARVDTEWWHRWVITASAICMWRGRIQFVGAPHPAPFPSALACWGPVAPTFREVFADRGWCVP